MKLSEIKKRIVSNFIKFDPEKIILFGSVARDDWGEESDVDVIVVYDTNKSFLDRLKELYTSWDIPKAVDILAYTPAEYREMYANNYFLRNVVDSGEMIYERN
jgi:predicted nucleotidyltransferase